MMTQKWEIINSFGKIYFNVVTVQEILSVTSNMSLNLLLPCTIVSMDAFLSNGITESV